MGRVRFCFVSQPEMMTQHTHSCQKSAANRATGGAWAVEGGAVRCSKVVLRDVVGVVVWGCVAVLHGK